MINRSTGIRCQVPHDHFPNDLRDLGWFHREHPHWCQTWVHCKFHVNDCIPDFGGVPCRIDQRIVRSECRNVCRVQEP